MNDQNHNLSFTGERYVPDQGWADIAYEHLSRYLFARMLTLGKHVLDVGSGEGYGSFLLSKTASNVSGLDISQEAVDHANWHYGKTKNLKYVRGSATGIPFLEGHFGVVVCFEMLEHIGEQDEMLVEIKRVLAPGGTALISTPNKYTYSDVPQYNNEFHVKELYLDEFVKLVGGHFPATRFFSQKNIAGSLIADLDESIPKKMRINRIQRKNDQNAFELIEQDSIDHLYFIAVCSDEQAVVEKVQSLVVADRDMRLVKESGEIIYARVEEEKKRLTDALAIQTVLTQDLSDRFEQMSAMIALEAAADAAAREIHRPVRRTLSILWERVPEAKHTYDLILPTYNAPDLVQKCLDSLIRYTDPRHHIYIVDDASSNLSVVSLLQTYEEKYDHVHVIVLEKNIGFAGAANHGFNATKNDIILINPDTVYTPQWLQRMDRCRSSDPRIHVVSPLSNNGTICSVPQINDNNIIPESLGLDDMARLVARTSLLTYPRVPTVVGFCMLMSRESINSVGLLDTTFGWGYGIEVDWCQRAWKMGMESALCDDAYVYHLDKPIMSATGTIDKHREAAEVMILERWPQYRRIVWQYCLFNPLRQHQLRIAETLRNLPTITSKNPIENSHENRTRILHITHSYEAKGGTDLCTQRLAQLLGPEFRTAVMYPGDMSAWADAIAHEDEYGVLRIKMNQGLLPLSHVINGIAMDIRSRFIERFFSQVVGGISPDIVHFQHFIGVGSFLLPSIARKLGAQVAITLHDYFLLCPEWNLISNGRLCGKSKSNDSDDCASCLAGKYQQQPGFDALDLIRYIKQRHIHTKFALDAAHVLIAPSNFVKEQFRRAWGNELADRIMVIPHGTLPRTVSQKKPSGELKVVFLGKLTDPKGKREFLGAVESLKMSSIRFYVVGGIAGAVPELPNLTVKSDYTPEQVPKFLSEVDVVVIPSVWNETYCYTLDEAFRVGLPVIATEVGALKERIQHEKTGLLVKPGDANDLASAIERLHTDRRLLDALRQGIREKTFKSVDDNIKEYKQLYKQLLTTTFDLDALIRKQMIAS